MRTDRVRRADLIAQSAQSGRCYSLLRPDLAEDAPVLAGRFEVTVLRPGLQIKRVEVRDLHDMRTEIDIQPSLHLVMLLSGRAEASFGPRHVTLGSNAGGRPEAALIALAEAERFIRQSQRGRYERKVGITLTPEWLDACGLDDRSLTRFRRQHLSIEQWQPSARAISLAAQMMSPPDTSPVLRRLYLESRALELASEAFARLGSTPEPALPTLGTRQNARMQAFRQWLDSGAADELSLTDIAQHVGLNAHSLQQQFRAAFGNTIFDYLRGRRLDAARLALETQDVSIAQAAHLAGYTSAANFATACKRRYGLSPSQLKQH